MMSGNFTAAALRAIRDWLEERLPLVDQAVLLLIAGLPRIWRLAVPDALVFDEIYFPVYANNYLEGVSFFDAHPPLGKYLIALGIRFFGFTPFGYRIVDALFGIGVIILIYRLTSLLFRDRRIGLIAGLLAAFDGVLLVESRAGLINIFAVYFNLAAYYLFFRAGDETPERPRWFYLAGAGICIGAGMAVKWISFGTFGVIAVLFVVAKTAETWPAFARLVPRGSPLKQIGRIHPDLYLATCVLIPIAVYGASFIIHLNQIPDWQFFELQRQIFGYHANLKAVHGYGSPWWSWPVLMRPVSYFYEFHKETEMARTILNIGNPLLWWLAIPAVLYGCWEAIRRWTFPVVFLLFAFLCHYLPFSLISRVSYLYHFMGALPFAIILLAFVVVRLWDRQGWRREVAAGIVLLIALAFIYFFPIWTAVEIPVGAYYQRMWFTSWI